MPNMPIMTSHKHRTANTPRMPNMTITTAYNITKMPSMTSHTCRIANTHSMPRVMITIAYSNTKPPTNSPRSSMTIKSTHTTNQPTYMTANMTVMTTKMSKIMRSRGVVWGGMWGFTRLLLRSVMEMFRVWGWVEGVGYVGEVLLRELRVVVGE